ncbi:hypothetical protein THAOC_04317 [Thalassiosira oceanica]|uniref:Uncharacterized protein n=1 Tax=Thalassiosira oceanica TaxID=159749 RepID=K0TJC9_THAOC|nr:hypothetical protein THAOC_04317 [Thalassiosira oceanica]|eukprot:EJK74031.1 hypothetical protein THAOC_04317 [Thalassiosira oceanica]
MGRRFMHTLGQRAQCQFRVTIRQTSLGYAEPLALFITQKGIACISIPVYHRLRRGHPKPVLLPQLTHR